MKRLLIAAMLPVSFSTALVVPAPTPAPTPTSAPVEAPRDRASGRGDYLTKVEGEMAKAPENRKGAHPVACPSFIREPGAKCVGFN